MPSNIRNSRSALIQHDTVNVVLCKSVESRERGYCNKFNWLSAEDVVGGILDSRFYHPYSPVPPNLSSSVLAGKVLLMPPRAKIVITLK